MVALDCCLCALQFLSAFSHEFVIQEAPTNETKAETDHFYGFMYQLFTYNEYILFVGATFHRVLPEQLYR